MASGFKFTPEICKKYGLGKNWYCESDKQEKDTVIEDIVNSQLPGEEKVRLLEGLRDLHTKRAVMDGRQEDIDKALQIQNIFAKKSVEFAKKMQRTAESNPKLATTHSNYKEDAEREIERVKLAADLQEASKRYIIVMVYNPDCLTCQVQLPKIIRMKELWGFANLGISETSNHLNGFDESITEQEVSKDEAITTLPTILLLDTIKKEKIFLSNGIPQVEEMENKIAQLIRARS